MGASSWTWALLAFVLLTEVVLGRETDEAQKVRGESRAVPKGKKKVLRPSQSRLCGKIFNLSICTVFFAGQEVDEGGGGGGGLDVAAVSFGVMLGLTVLFICFYWIYKATREEASFSRLSQQSGDA